MLRHLGFEVDTAADGKGALELYAPDRYVCVILDVTMPQLGGIETMRLLRAKDARAKIALSSGFDAEDVMSRLGSLRAEGFLRKAVHAGDASGDATQVTEAGGFHGMGD